ncbi:MAG: hypothetical protein ABIU20_09080 [Blastocatellia bacterium]
MKRFSILTACLFALALATAAFAQNPQPPQGKRAGRPHGKLKKMDANRDGQITRDEWKGKSKGFDRADQNNDGTISRDEAMAGRKAAGKRHLKRMDANNDGQIARGEWTGPADGFGKLDANNDGMLTREEMKAGRHRKQRPTQ